MAIRDVNGLAVLVNILRTDHINCQVTKEGLPLVRENCYVERCRHWPVME